MSRVETFHSNMTREVVAWVGVIDPAELIDEKLSGREALDQLNVIRSVRDIARKVGSASYDIWAEAWERKALDLVEDAIEANNLHLACEVYAKTVKDLLEEDRIDEAMRLTKVNLAHLRFHKKAQEEKIELMGECEISDEAISLCEVDLQALNIQQNRLVTQILEYFAMKGDLDSIQSVSESLNFEISLSKGIIGARAACLINRGDAAGLEEIIEDLDIIIPAKDDERQYRYLNYRRNQALKELAKISLGEGNLSAAIEYVERINVLEVRLAFSKDWMLGQLMGEKRWEEIDELMSWLFQHVDEFTSSSLSSEMEESEAYELRDCLSLHSRIRILLDLAYTFHKAGMTRLRDSALYGRDGSKWGGIYETISRIEAEAIMNGGSPEGDRQMAILMDIEDDLLSFLWVVGNISDFEELVDELIDKYPESRGRWLKRRAMVYGMLGELEEATRVVQLEIEDVFVKLMTMKEVVMGAMRNGHIELGEWQKYLNWFNKEEYEISQSESWQIDYDYFQELASQLGSMGYDLPVETNQGSLATDFLRKVWDIAVEKEQVNVLVGLLKSKEVPLREKISMVESLGQKGVVF